MESWTKKWEADRKKLKEVFADKGMVYCEARLPGCLVNNFLSFHHRHKRIWYKRKGRERLLGSFNQVILVCQSCHDLLENNKELSNKIFKELRKIDKRQ